MIDDEGRSRRGPAVPAYDLVPVGTPIDLGRIVNFKKDTVRVAYELEEIGTPTLKEILTDKFKK